VSAISHLVWHDIRALRLPLIAWLTLLLAQAAVMALGPGLIDPEAPRSLAVQFAGFLAGVRLAFTVLLTVLLVQRDSPVGTTAFWLTRPIRPAAMAASKLCSTTLLLVVLPAVVGWVLFNALGLPAPDLREGIWQLLLEQAMIVSLSAMGASITATIPQFAVVAVAAVLFISLLASEARHFIERLPAGWLPAGVTPLGAWVFATVLGTIAVIAYQYSRRQVARAVAAVTGVLVVGVLIAVAAPAPFGAAPLDPLRPGVLDPAAVRLSVDTSGVRAETGSTADAKGRQTYYRYAGAILQVTGSPPAVVLQPWSIEATWQPGEGAPIRWQRRQRAADRRTVQRDEDADGQPLKSILEALGAVELLGRFTAGFGTAFYATLLSLPEEDVSQLKSAQGPLEAAVTLRAWRYKVVESVPLAAGSSVSARQGRLTVRAIAHTPTGADIDVERVSVRRVMWTPDDLPGTGGTRGSDLLALRNTSRRQAVLSGSELGRQFDYSLLYGISGAQFVTGSQRIHFAVFAGGNQPERLDDAWLRDAELLVLRPEDLGVFTKSLRVEWVNLDDGK
jgi:hypothetical protein